MLLSNINNEDDNDDDNSDDDLTTRYWSTQSPSVGDNISVSTKSTRTCQKQSTVNFNSRKHLTQGLKSFSNYLANTRLCSEKPEMASTRDAVVAENFRGKEQFVVMSGVPIIPWVKKLYLG